MTLKEQLQKHLVGLVRSSDVAEVHGYHQDTRNDKPMFVDVMVFHVGIGITLDEYEAKMSLLRRVVTRLDSLYNAGSIPDFHVGNGFISFLNRPTL